MSSTVSAGTAKKFERLLPVGADVQADGGETHFRVWAPDHRAVEVVFEDALPAFPLENEGNGYFSGVAAGALAGTNYKYRPGGSKEAYPDPASRYQPQGPHGFSRIVDPRSYAWSDAGWAGVNLTGQVIYEMHVGTFTREGTWRSGTGQLEYLQKTGITLIELMPVGEFPGRFGWGYDGVQLFAPESTYGTPDEMRAFVNRAHELGLGVLLDVVYNHLGPDGNYLPKFARDYETERHKTDWGRAINFDGEGSGPVREYFLANAAYWIREFHLDGLRLDATQDIHDSTEPHILAEIGIVARAAASERAIVLIGENEPQNTGLIRPLEQGGCGLDGLWNDDFHHSAMVALSGKAEAYYTDYRGRAQEFVSALKHGYLYQGQWYQWQKKRRGRSNLGLPRAAMVTFIQNHDQVANSARGQRATDLGAPGVLKAITATMLLGPGTPMLFQGQEFGASTPFLYFADHKPELAQKIQKGREEFLEQWRSLHSPEVRQCMADPGSDDTFQRSKLDLAEVERHPAWYALHCDLIRLRRDDPVLSRQGRDGIDGAVLSDLAFVMRYFTPDFKQDRLLLVNLGTQLDLAPSPEPLLGCPGGGRWRKLWSTDDTPYGGCGTAPVDEDQNWIVPGQCAIVLIPATISE